MKISHERGKAVEVYNKIDFFHDHYHRTSSDVRCTKHPQLSSVGVCAYCLKDRLINLLSSDNGVRRLSSCSCTDIATNHRTSCVGDDGEVDRAYKEQVPNRDHKPRNSSYTGNKSEEVFLIKRSNSSCVEIKKYNRFWRIGRLFKKKRDEDCTGVSRSRSLCSFRGGGVLGYEDGSDLMNYSGARTSVSAARSSGFNGGLQFGGGDNDSGFIDLKFDLEAESKGEIPAMKKGAINGASMDGTFCNASSCEITMDDRGIKMNRKSFKGWRWMFKSPEK